MAWQNWNLKSNLSWCGWSKSKGEGGLPSNFEEIEFLRATIFWRKNDAREFASGWEMDGGSCSFGGDVWRSDFIVDQRRFGWLEASLMDSRLDAARDFVINLFAVEHAAREARRSGSALEAFHRRSSLRLRFLASTASGESQLFAFLGPDRWPVFRGATLSRADVIMVSIWFA